MTLLDNESEHYNEHHVYCKTRLTDANGVVLSEVKHRTGHIMEKKHEVEEFIWTKEHHVHSAMYAHIQVNPKYGRVNHAIV